MSVYIARHALGGAPIFVGDYHLPSSLVHQTARRLADAVASTDHHCKSCCIWHRLLLELPSPSFA
jgi:hypothetical protein